MEIIRYISHQPRLSPSISFRTRHSCECLCSFCSHILQCCRQQDHLKLTRSGKHGPSIKSNFELSMSISWLILTSPLPFPVAWHSIMIYFESTKLWPIFHIWYNHTTSINVSNSHWIDRFHRWMLSFRRARRYYRYRGTILRIRQISARIFLKVIESCHVILTSTAMITSCNVVPIQVSAFALR